MMSPKPI